MTFTGFGPDAVSFFDDLARDNTRAFFDSHREIYTRAIRQPMEDLLGDAEAKYGAGRMMRPNRDVRFSPNKLPYRTEASMWAGTVGGVYLSLNASRIEAGGGLYEPTRDQLARARAAIDEQPLSAAELREILATATARGFEIAGPSLKTAPRGYDKNHPSIELLRLKHFAVLRRLPTEATRANIQQVWADVEPLIAWTEKYIGVAVSQP